MAMLIGARQAVDLPKEKPDLVQTTPAPPDVAAMGPRLELRLPKANVSLEQAMLLMQGKNVDGLAPLYTDQGLNPETLREVARWINPQEVVRKSPSQWLTGTLAPPKWARRLWSQAVANPTSPLWEMLYANEVTRTSSLGPQQATSLRLDGVPARVAWERYVEWQNVHAVDLNTLEVQPVDFGVYGNTNDVLLYLDVGKRAIGVFDHGDSLKVAGTPFPLRIFHLTYGNSGTEVFAVDVLEDMTVVPVPPRGEIDFIDAHVDPDRVDPNRACNLVRGFSGMRSALIVTVSSDSGGEAHTNLRITASGPLLQAWSPSFPIFRLQVVSNGPALASFHDLANWKQSPVVVRAHEARYCVWRETSVPASLGVAGMFIAPCQGDEAPMWHPTDMRTVTMHLLMHYDLDRGTMDIVLPGDERPTQPSPTGLRHANHNFSSALCFISSQQIERDSAPVFYDGGQNSVTNEYRAPARTNADYTIKEPPSTAGNFALVRRTRGVTATPTTFSSHRGFVWPDKHWNIARLGGYGDAPVWFGLYMERVDPRNGIVGEVQLAVLDVQDKLYANEMEMVTLHLLTEWTSQGQRWSAPAREYHFKLSYVDEMKKTMAQLMATPSYQGCGAWYLD